MSKMFVCEGQGDPGINQGLALVALSRTNKCEDMLLAHFPETRLTKIGKTPKFYERKEEFKKILPALASKTLVKHATLWEQVRVTVNKNKHCPKTKKQTPKEETPEITLVRNPKSKRKETKSRTTTSKHTQKE